MMKAKRTIRVVMLIAGLAAVTAVPFAWSGSGPAGKRTCDLETRKDKDTGTFPVPFDALNRKVELADGENYLLSGTIVYRGAQPFLALDLREHSWLASRARMDDPYYPLQPAASIAWTDYEGRRVQLQFRAHGRVVRRDSGSYEYEISLEALTKPQILPEDEDGGEDEPEEGGRGADGPVFPVPGPKHQDQSQSSR